MPRKDSRPGDINILPRNFGELLASFYGVNFENEVKFGRFKVDFYSQTLETAFEYDGIQHYSVVQKIESDKRKNELLRREGVKLVRWPYYFMPTKETCQYIFQDQYSEQKFSSMLQKMFATNDENLILAPGFHSTPNIPANFIWPGIDRFLDEMQDCPKNLRHQVRYSLKLYIRERAANNAASVIPTHHKKFMAFFHENDEPSSLNFFFANNPHRKTT